MKSIWDKVKTPPASALKEITGGRLTGMTDISPMWRIEAATELWGPCGIGWKYDIVELWSLPATNDEVAVFARVNLYYKHGEEWSFPIPGIGGSMFVTNQKNGPYASDECYKMAVTDALSVAFKALGFGADVYYGRTNTKYAPPPDPIPGIPAELKDKLRAAGCTTVAKARQVIDAFNGDYVQLNAAGEFFEWDIPAMISAQRGK